MAWQEFPIIGFAPDLPLTTPGNIISSRYCIPTDKGIATAPYLADYSSSAVNSASMGGALLSDTSATEELIVGTATKLYGMPTSGTTLTDRSAGAYNATSTNTWSVTQFGNKVLAVNLGDQLQQRTIGAAANFASIGAAPVPKASIVITAGPTSAPFVVVFDYADGTNTDRDGWKCSAISDYTGWTAGTNQCATGRLLDNIPGPITAAIPYRDGIIAWKRTGMYVGTYTGAPYIWSWQRISGDIGCIGKNACVEADDIIYFANDNGLWMYDGSYPKKMDGYVHNWWANFLTGYSTADRNYIRITWDKPKHLLWFILGNSTPVISSAISFNTNSRRWIGVETGKQPFTNNGETLNAQEMISARYTVNDSSLKVGNLAFPATSSLLAPTGSIGSWIIGDHVNTPVIKGVRPIVSSAKTAVGISGGIYYFTDIWTVSPTFAPTTGGLLSNLTQRTSTTYLDGVGSSQYMRYSITFNSPFEMSGWLVNMDNAGKT